ncbi:MAG: ABC transporter permease [Chloroflexi bacterium]|nr:ABC transporter permease [Chloroflexota bacterium]MXX47836.1 ABC transporter permease [Chloroflexota bacterium]MYA02353.1 ABC transporter permease [Chloroflexota bacterium]MYJ92424.1 ABC transporter permease [Chloroflexota bacterium]
MTAIVQSSEAPQRLLQRFRNLGVFQEAAPIIRVFVRNRPAVVGAFLLFGFGIVAAFAPLIAPADPLTTNLRLESVFQPPSWDHIFGTDAQGRDVLSRTLYGARIAWQIVLAAIGVAIVLGVPLGLISGYIGGKLDELIIMRIVDALMAMPGLILILAVTGALGPSITNSMIVIGIVWSPGYARLTRGIIVSIRNDVYVDAARALGATPWRIMWRHLLPNAVAPIMVLASLSAAGIILVEAGLSFIGAGVQPPTPAWGGMVSEAYKTLIRRNGWPMIGPAAAIILMVIAFNFVGDGIRDAFDPRLRNVR